MPPVALDIVERHAGVNVPGLGPEVELRQVLLELAVPRLRHAGDLRGGGGEDLPLLDHALLGVMAHDLDDALRRLRAPVLPRVAELAEERLADGRRAERFRDLD